MPPSSEPWRVVLINAGMTANRRIYMPEVLNGAAALYEGAPVYVGHSWDSGAQDDADRRLFPDVDQCEPVASIANVAFATFVDRDGRRFQRLIATLTARSVAFHRRLLRVMQIDRFRHVGLSHLVEGRFQPFFLGDEVWTWVHEITRVRSVDLVARPAACGRVLGLCPPA